MNTIKIENLQHKYGSGKKEIQALKSIDLEIKQGETIAFIGPDGVGKSTLFDIISGIKKIQTGKVFVLGGDISNAKFRNQVAPDIAYMTQGLSKKPKPKFKCI